MAYLALDPVSQAIYTVLNVSALTALATGGIADDLGQKRGYPFVMYTVSGDASATGLGTKPGQSLLSALDIRVHVFSKPSTSQGASLVAQTVMKKVIELLSATDGLRSSLTANSYRLCGAEPFYLDTVPAGASVVAGDVVNELVANFRVYVEEI